MAEDKKEHYKLRVKNAVYRNRPMNKDDDYYTPVSVINKFGTFDYDPATTKERAKLAGIRYCDTIETDGLTTEWNFKRIWINPPFTKKKEFLF